MNDQSENPSQPSQQSPDQPSPDQQSADRQESESTAPDVHNSGSEVQASAPEDPMAAAMASIGGGIDFGAMMQAAQSMQSQVAQAQEQLGEARVVGTAGGGLVSVTLNGHLHLLEVNIDPGAIDPDDPSIVGDLVRAAWQGAHDQVAVLQAQADPMAGLLGGGLGGGPGGGSLGGLGDLLGGL